MEIGEEKKIDDPKGDVLVRKIPNDSRYKRGRGRPRKGEKTDSGGEKHSIGAVNGVIIDGGVVNGGAVNRDVVNGGAVNDGTVGRNKSGKGKYVGNEITEMLNTLVNNLYDIQKVRIAIENRNRALLEKNRELIFNDHVSRMKKLESDTVKEIGIEIGKFKITKWMTGQRGIGTSLAGQTIAIIRDIGRFSNVAKLWAYSGMATMEVCTKCGKKVLRSPKREEWIVRVAKRLEDQNSKKKIRDSQEAELIGIDAAVIGNDGEDDDHDTNFAVKAKKMLCACENPTTNVVAQRRIKGAIIDYNPKMKKLCRNMALSLIQYNTFYGDLYRGYLAEYEQRDNLLANINQKKYTEAVLEKIRASKAVKMARRKMIKIFLSHLWEKWRIMDGLPVTKPYIFSVAGHSDYIKPPEVEESNESGDNDDDRFFGVEE